MAEPGMLVLVGTVQVNTRGLLDDGEHLVEAALRLVPGEDGGIEPRQPAQVCSARGFGVGGLAIGRGDVAPC
jgi:hypothetical protein